MTKRQTISGRKHYASYKTGVQWIADRYKQSPNNLDFFVAEGTVNLLAVLFGTSPEEVAIDVLKRRIKKDAGK